MRHKSAFTMVEIMVVIILIGIMAAFAIPNYSASLRRANERDMGRNLIFLRDALMVYHAGQGTFPTADLTTINDINTALDTHIIPNGKAYYYVGDANPNTFMLNATWASPGGSTLELSIDQAPADTNNPCCGMGSCVIWPTVC
jgi:prepilin-type N-terminal cleavage/methylation domain-containing protein